MMINAKVLRPKLTLDDVDVYLPRGIAALKAAKANPLGLFRIFQRHPGARFFGLTEYLTALASLVGKKAAGEVTIYAAPEGYALKRHETAMTLEGPAQVLLANETLLHYLTTGTRARTLAADFPVSAYPWAFMGARYLAQEDLAQFTRALAEEDILSTVPRWADRFIGTESHSQIAMWAGLRLDEQVEQAIAGATSDPLLAATARATVAFAYANPGVPLYVLGDFAARSKGCFEAFRVTAQVCQELGLELLGGRMDISKADLDDQQILDQSLRRAYASERWHLLTDVTNLVRQGKLSPSEAESINRQDHEFLSKEYAGMSLAAVAKVRAQLNRAGMSDFKLVVSSGIKLEQIKDYVAAGATLVGVGEEAAYYLNQGQCNYTSDAVGFFEGDILVPFAKEGRELERVVGKALIENAHPGVKIAEHLVPMHLTDFL